MFATAFYTNVVFFCSLDREETHWSSMEQGTSVFCDRSASDHSIEKMFPDILKSQGFLKQAEVDQKCFHFWKVQKITVSLAGRDLAIIPKPPPVSQYHMQSSDPFDTFSVSQFTMVICIMGIPENFLPFSMDRLVYYCDYQNQALLISGPAVTFLPICNLHRHHNFVLYIHCYSSWPLTCHFSFHPPWPVIYPATFLILPATIPHHFLT